MKRIRDQEDGSEPVKKVKVNDSTDKHFSIEQITSARQLKHALVFQQDSIPDLRSGIASFKALLETILYGSNAEASEAAKAILREYLDSERPRQGQEIERPFLSQLWQAWSFSSSNNNDHLSSAVCAIFALLLKTLASMLDFKDHGMLLCRTVMQHQHLRHIKRCLDAPKHKEFLLSPSLRLLTEVASFDGGVNVRELYKHREQTFDVAALRKCLSLIKEFDPEDENAYRRPAVRTLAVRYILTHLKYQDEGAKIDILKQRPLANTLFGFLRADPPDLVADVFRITELHVLKDNGLPRSTKIALLSEQQLQRVTEIATRSENDSPTSKTAFKWLKTAITTPSYGILQPRGWYSLGLVRHEAYSGVDPDVIDQDLDDTLDDTDSVRNPILAAWIKDLRPGTNPQERELILACFQAAPELVFQYFTGSKLQMEPKLTNTWMGYASFMFEVIASPVPRYLGNIETRSYAEQPPRVQRMLDSILPSPLTQKVLVRCLNQNSKLISFFAIRLLIVALSKLRTIAEQVSLASSRSSHHEAWSSFLEQVTKALIDRVPTAKDIANVYRSLPADDEHLLQREAAAKLLRLYYELLPSATEDSFDISSAILPLLAPQSTNAERSTLWSAAELGNLLVVAQHSTTLKWFQRQGGLSISPIVCLLLKCTASNAAEQHLSVARSVLEQAGVLERATDAARSAFDALIYSLRDVSEKSGVWDCLDDCLARAVKMPVKYLDDADELKSALDSDASISLLLLVMLEQARFIVGKESKERKTIIKWINHFTAYLEHSSEASPLTQEVRSKIENTEKWRSSDIDIDEAFLQPVAAPEPVEASNATQANDSLPYAMPLEENVDHPELFRWQRKDLDLAIDDGDIDSLLACLSSTYPEVRKQAVGQIDKLCNAVQASSIEEKEQLFLVLGEVLETYRVSFELEDKPLPHLLSSFATRTVHIQLEPTHLMFTKVNRFLMKGPAWRPQSLSRYWLAATALSEPTEDSEHWAEVQWTLDWLVDGMRTQQDFDLLRQAGSLERLMAIHAATGSAQKQIRSRVLELIYRMAMIDSLSLITRAGALSWLEMVEGELPKKLRKLVKTNSDARRLEAWAGVPVEAV